MRAGTLWLLCTCLAAAGRAPAQEGRKQAGEPPPAPPPQLDALRVDGEVFEGELRDGDASGLDFLVDGESRTVDPKRLVSVRLSAAPPALRPAPFNLYLANGDRLNGRVAGHGKELALEGRSGTRLRAPLAQVRADHLVPSPFPLHEGHNLHQAAVHDKGRQSLGILNVVPSYALCTKLCHLPGMGSAFLFHCLLHCLNLPALALPPVPDRS